MGITIKHSKQNTKIATSNKIKSKAQKATDILSNGLWKGKRCFILGGGPSMRNFNFDCLKNELTIGINVAFTKYPTTVNYAMDKSLYRKIANAQKFNPEEFKLLQQWENYKGKKIWLSTKYDFPFNSDVFVVKRIHNEVLSLDINEGIYGANNSGWGALNLAMILGANPIYLIGYDMKTDLNNQKSHWHDIYKPGDLINMNRKMGKFIQVFDTFAPLIEDCGFEVINLNPDSALECFKKQELKNVI